MTAHAHFTGPSVWRCERCGSRRSASFTPQRLGSDRGVFLCLDCSLVNVRIGGEAEPRDCVGRGLRLLRRRPGRSGRPAPAEASAGDRDSGAPNPD